MAELTKQEKIEKIEALKEKRRRLLKKRPQYTPNEGQRPVHSSKMRNRFVFSANGAGKTTMAVQEAVWAAKGFNPITEEYYKVPASVIVVLDRPDKVKDVWLPEMKKWHNIEDKWLFKNGLTYINEIKFPNGSSIRFMFHQMDQMAFESIEVDFVIFDEPCPRRIYIALRRGGRKKSGLGRYLLIGTPIAAPWLRTEVYDRWIQGKLPDTECFRTDISVNLQNLAEGYLESFGSTLTENEKKVRLAGEFFDSAGLALAHLFKRSTHTISKLQFERQWNPAHPVVLAIDPHPSKKHVAVLLGLGENGQLYYIKELAEKLIAKDFAEKLRAWYNGYRVIDIVVDSLGSADYTGGDGFKSFIQVLRENGVRARATTFKDKNDEDFIERIRGSLKSPEKPQPFTLYRPKLVIVEGNEGIIKDIENVGWMTYKDIEANKPKLDIRQHDYLACLKYALAANINGAVSGHRKHRVNGRKKLYGF